MPEEACVGLELLQSLRYPLLMQEQSHNLQATWLLPKVCFRYSYSILRHMINSANAKLCDVMCLSDAQLGKLNRAALESEAAKDFLTLTWTCSATAVTSAALCRGRGGPKETLVISA